MAVTFSPLQRLLETDMNLFPEQSPNWWATFESRALHFSRNPPLGSFGCFCRAESRADFRHGGRPSAAWISAPDAFAIAPRDGDCRVRGGCLALLEWRSKRWPRYRNLAVGLGVFVLNSAILGSFFLLIIGVVAVAPALMKGVH
jgi:hypothetical protein